MGKYDNWQAIILHPIAGRLIQVTAPPHSVILYSPKLPKDLNITVIYHLEWRDMKNELAYYKIGSFLSDKILRA